MKLSLGLPHYGRESSPEVIARFAHEAEQLDYDAVWALERLLRPVKPRSAPFPGWTPPAYYANVYDPIETSPSLPPRLGGSNSAPASSTRSSTYRSCWPVDSRLSITSARAV